MFQTLHWRLLISYLGVMTAILGTSTVAVYQLFAYSIYQQLDSQLFTLADAATHNLLLIKADRAAVRTKVPRTFDNDGDLDIPWQDLRQHHQGVEWFDAEAQLLAKAGTISPKLPLARTGQVSAPQTLQQNQIRTIAVPVYPHEARGNQRLEGYVRVSQSTEDVETELSRLRWGLGLGGIVALLLTGVGGLWLTRQSVQPIEISFQRLKQVNQQLKQFTADASHELRSPLTVIKTSIQVMMTHPERIHPADVEKLEAIANATGQMTRLVEDLLFLARTDTTTITPGLEWGIIPIDELLEDLFDLLSPQAEAKKVILKLDLAEGLFVKGDPIQLKRLFSNLIENALQYTPSGGNVTVSLVHLNNFVLAKIEDTGIGIASEHIPLVFHRFWRADKARKYRAEGSGLGLAIASAIAQRHAGAIAVTSQVGVGSCFEVRLPIAS